VHRDVSPSNILIAEPGAVKLTDFGIAKAPNHQSVMFKVKGKVGYILGSVEVVTKDVLKEAQAIFPNTSVARDFDSFQIKREE